MSVSHIQINAAVFIPESRVPDVYMQNSRYTYEHFITLQFSITFFWHLKFYVTEPSGICPSTFSIGPNNTIWKPKGHPSLNCCDTTFTFHLEREEAFRLQEFKQQVQHLNNTILWAVWYQCELSDLTVTSNYTEKMTAPGEIHAFANRQCQLAGIIVKARQKKMPMIHTEGSWTGSLCSFLNKQKIFLL